MVKKASAHLPILNLGVGLISNFKTRVEVDQMEGCKRVTTRESF